MLLAPERKEVRRNDRRLSFWARGTEAASVGSLQGRNAVKELRQSPGKQIAAVKKADEQKENSVEKSGRSLGGDCSNCSGKKRILEFYAYEPRLARRYRLTLQVTRSSGGGGLYQHPNVKNSNSRRD